MARTVRSARGADFTLREALREPSFWWLSLGHGAALFVVGAVNVHMVSHLNESLGYSLGAAAVTGAASIPVQLIRDMREILGFDTVLSAVALTKNFIVMTSAIILSGILMVMMADAVAAFLNRNRMYEVVGLFVLLLVGIMLTTEGGHLAHLAFFGVEIHALEKATFYFVLVTMVAVEIVQGRYQRKLLAEKRALSRKSGRARA